MIKQLLVLLLIFFSVSLPALSQDWQWVKDAGGLDYSESSRIATDASGNSYVTGNYARSVTFGTTTLTGGPDGNTFLVKYSNDGQLVWAKQIKGTSVVETMDMAVDGSGNIYVTGNFKGTATVGAFTLTSPDDRAAFVAKFDATGNVVWAKQANSTEVDDVRGENITVDGSGNVYVTGNFFSSATFGATTITATRDEQVFIAKYAANGNLTWVKMAGGLGSCFTHDIATDNSGNLYLTGQFWLTATFGSTTLYKDDSIITSGEVFIAKYDASGNALWAKQAGGAGSDAATGIVVDDNGNSYITGFFQGTTAAFGSATVTGNSAKNVFLAKYSAAGGFMWVRKQQASGDAAGTAIDLDASGNIYTTGYFEGSATFGNATLISYGSYDMFFAKYDANGTVTGTMQAGGAGMDVAKGLDVNANGGIYFTGDFSGPATFGATTLSEGIVVGKLNSISYNQEPAPTITPGSLNSNIVCRGASVEIPFSTTGRFGADNVFTVQLSDYWGSFAYPTGIGSSKTSPVTATIPAEFALGTGYKIRVIASSPGVTGAVNGTVTINKPPVVTASVASKTIAAGSSTTLYATGADTYAWSPATGLSNASTANPVATPQTTTTYTVTGTRNGCSSTASVTVRVDPVPPLGSAFTWSSVMYEANAGRSSAKVTAADDKGNVYVAGEFTTSIKLGSTTLTDGTGSGRIFLAKYNSEGQVLWVKQMDGTFLADMAVDANGNVYVVGSFGLSIRIGEQTLTASNGANFFVAKYSGEGDVAWVTQTRGLDYSVSTIAVSSVGELYISGAYRGTATFNAISLSGGDTNELFIVKYDSGGTAVWGKSIKGSGAKNYELDIATDAEGDVYLTSSISIGTLEFNSFVLTNSKGVPNTFIAKYLSDGQFQWAKLVNYNNEDYSYTRSSQVAVDKNKNVYLLGHFDRFTKFEAGPPLSAAIAGFNVFLAKYDTNGSFQWVMETGGSFTAATGFTIDADDFLYVTGAFNYSATFGTKQFVIGNTDTQVTDHGIFVVKYDVNGNVIWAENATTKRRGDLISRGISVDNEQNIFIVGSFDRSGFHDPIKFGCQTIENSGEEHYFLAKLKPHAGLPPTIRVGSVGETVCAGLSIVVPFSASESDNACTTYAVILSDDKGSFQNAQIIGTGTGSPITATIPSRTFPGDGYRINVISSSPAITGADNGTDIKITALPVALSSTSRADPCPGTAGIVYTASSSSQITSYNWSVPADWAITGGHGTNRITVTAGASAGEVAVVVSGVCGTEARKSMSVTPISVFAPTVIETAKSLCGTGNVVFIASGAPSGAMYRWYASATGAEPIWENTPYGSESRFYTPVVSVNTTFYVSLLFSSGCESERVPLTITIRPKPDTPGAITASSAACTEGAEVTYQVPVASHASGYEWRVPFGWVILSGQGTKSIRVRTGATSGEVSVTAYNGCGFSTAQVLAVQAGVPVGPATTGESRCGAGSVTLYADGAPEGSTYRWYSAAVGGTAIVGEIGREYVTPYLSSSTTYYVSVVTAGGCESPRAAVTATITSAATAKAGPDETVCVGAPSFALRGYSPAGGEWSGVGVAANGEFVPSAAGVGVHTLTYSFPQNSCLASATKTITVTPEPILTLAPYGEVCSTVRDFNLLEGQPMGGMFSGVGVDSVWFDATVAGAGTHLITYTYNFDGGCTVSTTQAITVTTCTGLPESKLAAKLVVYPNPTQSDLNVALPLSKGTALSLRLFDAKGQKVYEQQYPKLSGEFKQVVSLKNKARGVYLLQLILDDGVVTKRVVVE
ncbi:SBBP repeat-containing protein [Pontibacter diazotrophicus]|nr:SBBP repeat-containing protein [Pontibacter diazotrophicus]